MRSRIFNLNWEDFNYRDPEQRKQLAGALQYFCALPNKFIPANLAKVQEFVKRHKEIQEAQIQMFTLPSDFPTYEKAIDVVRKFTASAVYDAGYEQIFDVLDFAGSKASGFDVMDITGGLTFNQIKPGEKVKVYQISGSKERCYFAYYGGALGWFRGLFEDQEWVTVDLHAATFRNVAYATRAGVFYNLLDTAADLKGCCSAVPADCTDCHSDALSIANSINFAAQTILRNVENKGYGINPQTTQFIVLTPLELRGRVRLALGVRNQAFGEAERVIDYNFTQITSLMPANHNRVMVILPKNKILAGYRMDLTLFDDFDILSYTDTVAGWMRYGGCIGDLDQIECIEFTAQSGSCPTSPEGRILVPTE